MDAWNDVSLPNNPKMHSKGAKNDIFAKYAKQAEEARKAMEASDEEDGTIPKVEAKTEANTVESS